MSKSILFVLLIQKHTADASAEQSGRKSNMSYTVAGPESFLSPGVLLHDENAGNSP